MPIMQPQPRPAPATSTTVPIILTLLLVVLPVSSTPFGAAPAARRPPSQPQPITHLQRGPPAAADPGPRAPRADDCNAIHDAALCPLASSCSWCTSAAVCITSSDPCPLCSELSSVGCGDYYGCEWCAVEQGGQEQCVDQGTCYEPPVVTLTAVGSQLWNTAQLQLGVSVVQVVRIPLTLTPLRSGTLRIFIDQNTSPQTMLWISKGPSSNSNSAPYPQPANATTYNYTNYVNPASIKRYLEIPTDTSQDFYVSASCSTNYCAYSLVFQYTFEVSDLQLNPQIKADSSAKHLDQGAVSTTTEEELKLYYTFKSYSGVLQANSSALFQLDIIPATLETIFGTNTFCLVAKVTSMTEGGALSQQVCESTACDTQWQTREPTWDSPPQDWSGQVPSPVSKYMSYPIVTSKLPAQLIHQVTSHTIGSLSYGIQYNWGQCS
ncbi:hypothetical protein Pelo_15524 [Pelomyxa schiedti]|nr:hypothetical protein Pelo_15524 [Pelomyxa schiedti]